MRNSDSFDHGLFCYGRISADIIRIKNDLEDMDDYDMIDEIYNMYLSDLRADDIIIDFYAGGVLREWDRDYLVNFYINAKVGYGIHVDELGR